MERLTVIGCGTMGHSIALSAAWAGISVALHGLTENDTAAGLAGIEKKLEVLVENDLILTSEKESIIASIRPTDSLEDAIIDASFIIECIPEDLVLKNNLFRTLDSQCASDVILASNTSGLRLSDIARGTLYPERILLTHFWNPAHLMPLVEVLRAPMTTDHIVKRTISLLKRMDKVPVQVKKEIPGLIGNRLQFALFREAQHLLDQGIATKEDIDAAVTLGIGRRLALTGPLMSADMGGLDVFNSISNNLFKHLSSTEECYPALENLVSKKKFGEKSGEGYYFWDKESSDRINKLREKFLIRQLKDDSSKTKRNS